MPRPHPLSSALILVTLSYGCERQGAEPATASTPPDAQATPPSTGIVPPARSFPKVQPIQSLKRCVNLGNALDAPKEGEWGVTLEENHFKLAKAGGFDHVRLPVRFSAHAAETAPYTIDETFFKRVDWAIAQALAQGLSIIVEVHHYNELMEKPDLHAPRLVGLWQQIAKPDRSRPARAIPFSSAGNPTSRT
jgi:endoglucanase